MSTLSHRPCVLRFSPKVLWFSRGAACFTFKSVHSVDAAGIVNLAVTAGTPQCVGAQSSRFTLDTCSHSEERYFSLETICHSGYPWQCMTPIACDDALELCKTSPAKFRVVLNATHDTRLSNGNLKRKKGETGVPERETFSYPTR